MGKIHYFNGQFSIAFVSLPEGTPMTQETSSPLRRNAVGDVWRVACDLVDTPSVQESRPHCRTQSFLSGTLRLCQQFAIENDHLQWIFPLKRLIFHRYVIQFTRGYLGFTKFRYPISVGELVSFCCRRRRSRKVNITIGEKKEAREKGKELQVLQAPAGALRITLSLPTPIVVNPGS